MLKTCSITDIGKKRQLNQDIVFTSDQKIGNLPNVFIVADGMGGHKAGDYASRYTVETITEEIANSLETTADSIIRGAIVKANQNVKEAADADDRLSGMGSTVVVATYDGTVLEVANVGDSRLYVVNQDNIHQITTDHSLVEEMVRMGGLARADARTHPDKNIITRAVGAQNLIEVDFFEVILHPGDIVLLCSDGLTNMLEDQEIKEILNLQDELFIKAGKLVELANQNGGKDNIAVVLMEPFAE
ncbi:MAG: Stp1/IreP family PP2C-type Ser/Thr phosphatase [Lachnospiraceae bacterium]